jgi:hypothetical protein
MQIQSLNSVHFTSTKDFQVPFIATKDIQGSYSSDDLYVTRRTLNVFIDDKKKLGNL